MNVKRLLPVVVLAVIAAGAVGYYMYNKPHKVMSKQTADFKLSAEDLVSGYSDEKYLGKIIEVQGKISEIATDTGNQKIILETSDPMSGIICQMDHLSEHPQLSLVQTGDHVALKGYCTGQLLDIVLDRCVFIQ